jgi:hypothetical protein
VETQEASSAERVIAAPPAVGLTAVGAVGWDAAVLAACVVDGALLPQPASSTATANHAPIPRLIIAKTYQVD